MDNSKINKVINWLEEGKPITSLMAVQLFGITNFPSIIFRLRQKGYNIITEKRKDVFGNVFTQYILDDGK